MYGTSASVPDRGIVDRIVWSYLDALSVTPGVKKLMNGTLQQNGSIDKKSA